MDKAECNDIDEFVIKSANDKRVNDVNSAGVINADRIVPLLVNNPRYHLDKNKNEPPKIDSHLVLFDCITCNKCIPVCPNAANFSIPVGKKNFEFVDYQFSNGKLIPSTHQHFVLEYEHQIANLADFCNDCGDCDTYCPEFGGPFIEKPRFFFNEESYSKNKNDNGFYFTDSSTLRGRIGKSEYELSYIENDDKFKLTNKNFQLFLDENDNLVDFKLLNDIDDGTKIEMKDYYIMKTLFLGIKNNKEIYPAVLLLND
jgi:putative selenate reductase